MTDLQLIVLDCNGNQVPLKLTLDPADGVTNIPHHIVDGLPAIPAGTNAIGTVDIAPAQVIQRSSINFATGTGIIVAAVAGKNIRILGLALTAAANCTIQFFGAGGALTGIITLLAGQEYLLPMTQPGYHWMESGIGNNFNIVQSGTVQISGTLVYAQY